MVSHYPLNLTFPQLIKFIWVITGKKNLAIYLDWQKLVLVVLGEGGGGALSQQVVIVQQDSDIVEDLRLIIVQTTSFVHQPLPRQTPQVGRAAGNSSPLAPVSTDEACWNISDFG